MSGIKTFRFGGWLLAVMLISALVSGAWFGLRQTGGGFRLSDFSLSRLNSLAQTWAAYSAAGNMGGLKQPAGAAAITPSTEVIREYHYKWCGHNETGKATKDLMLVGLTAEQLHRLYPASEGWEVEFVKPDRLVLRLYLEELCPADTMKRHLGEVDGRVAIFIGPSHYRGALEKMTSIRLSDLPVEWQELISQGTLEFGDVETLNQALDNLDEYYW